MHGKRGAGVRTSGAVLGTALLLAGCSPGDGDRGGAGARIGQRPAGSDLFWVNPDGNAARQVAAYEKAGKDAEADQIRKIAEQPTGEWIGPENPEREARGYTEAAEKADRTALLVLYNIPHRDCGQYSQGGAADGDAYRSWIDGVAKGIGDRPATVVLEPDALLHLVDGCTPEEHHEERYDLLDGAVATLKSLKATKVYVDAGNAGWGHPDQIFEPLRRAGVSRADGFAVNVSNYYATAASVTYGKELSAKVGGKPFVVDTSRNGNGPWTGGSPDERWCNPPGRALGEPPTAKTGDPLVDAYLWVKRPGESDGTCKGGPKAGAWWPAYALKLARATR
ncbi:MULTISPECIES: glycoside hydrolase family 6 protein [Streptomyces]|uniref:Glucanase n=1 Tax=Streptomyces doudnae TaxID=3075536 RepID=A0ABD5EMT7_9ACTN|nr:MULTISPECIES: glycoside hydrolase family 6 protein [unclassified Streptomyces]MDT0435910.1 glycoside hydrolase family 6 protein [Streptomyces sp. DSM 41981]MYQ64214.1 endoglucanase [Streptomyces sp. SID4950]SCD74089.1 endoglucanase [Streptomyces sp. SolWspMP-5a-2]